MYKIVGGLVGKELIFLSKTGSYSLAQAGFELTIL